MSLLARLDRLPLSRPHYLLLLIGGLGYTFDGMDAAVVAFLLPSVQDLWHLANGALGLIGSASPFGYLFGAAIAGILGDRIGRKRVMMYALAFYVVFTLVAAAAPNFPVFMGARVLAGAGTGAESAIIAPFLSEFVPSKRRGWFVGALAGFFSFGFVAAALIGRFIVPLGADGWRWAQVVTAVPIVMLLWWRRALPESPRYLLERGGTRRPRRSSPSWSAAWRSRPAAHCRRSSTHADVAPASKETAPPSVWTGLRFLWSRKMAQRTGVTWVMWFVITFSYYGFFSWIPTLLVQRGITVTQSFSFSLIIYAAQVPGYFSAAWLSERLDRKHTIALYLTGSALSAYWLSQTSTPVAITVSGAVLSFFLNGTYAGLYAYTPEVFPTWIRATGSGLASAFGRIGSIIAPTVIGLMAAGAGFAGVFGMTTAVLAVGVVVTLAFGLSTANRSLEDIGAPVTSPASPAPATAPTTKE